MSITAGYVGRYLYGLEHTPLYDESGKLSIEAEALVDHTWGTKQIPSGFFNQPGSEVVSAVIINADGTINKFNRMAYSAGFGRQGILKVLRDVFVWDQDPNASKPHHQILDVGDPSYFECWGEGINVYHNPNALHPFPTDLFRFGAHHQLKGNQIASATRSDFHPITSTTVYLLPEPSGRKPSLRQRVVQLIMDCLRSVAKLLGLSH